MTALPLPLRSTVARVTRAVGVRRVSAATVLRVGFCGLLARVVVGLVTPAPWLGTPVSPDMTSGFDPVLVALFLVGALLVAPAAVRLARRGGAAVARCSTRDRRLLTLAAFVVVLAGQSVLAIATTKTPGFDAGEVLTSAWNRAHPGNGLGIGLVDGTGYYEILPNNLLLGWAEWQVFGALGAVGLGSYSIALGVMVGVNVVALSASAVTVLAIARRLFGAPAALLALPPVLLLIGVSPWINTPYSDTFGIALTVLVLYLAVRAAESPTRSPLMAWAGFGALVALSVAVKPTIALLVVPAFVPALVARRAGGARGIAARVAALAVSAVVVHYGLLILIDVSGFVPFSVFNDPNELPFSHLMLMGARGVGGFDGATLSASMAIRDPHVRAVYDFKEWWATVSGMGPAGYLEFLDRKLFWMLGDGSFFQSKEGDGFVDFAASGPIWSRIRSVWVIAAPLHFLLASAWQAAWLGCLAAAAAPLVVGDPRGRRVWTSALRVAVLVLLAFLLISEGRSRYLYIALPVLVPLAAAGMMRAADAVRLRRARRSRGAAG